ncbi:hypothetical protein [Magnetofaba australis]|nr:hypothetical protein [Magnetofaba australis]
MSEQQITPQSQLDAIHAMLDESRHSVRVDGHTLTIWGVAGGLLCVVGDLWITHENFPEAWMRALAVLGLVGGVLALAAGLDWRMTRRAHQLQERTLSFVHQRVRRVWWYLMGLGVAMNVGMVIFGGGFLSYSMWLFLVGLALVVQGLFSRQPLIPLGVAFQVIAVGMLASGVEYVALRWITAIVLGVGLPLAAWMLPRLESAQAVARHWLAMGGWLALMTALSVASVSLLRATSAPAGAEIPLAQWRAGGAVAQGPAVLALPPGAALPLTLTFNSDALERPLTVESEVKLTRPLWVEMVSGEPGARLRSGAGPWRKSLYALRVRQLSFRAQADAEAGLRLQASMRMDVRE